MLLSEDGRAASDGGGQAMVSEETLLWSCLQLVQGVPVMHVCFHAGLAFTVEQLHLRLP